MNALAPIPLPHEMVAALRQGRGETLETFGRLIGKVSKGVMSELERGLRQFTAEQALAIEALSHGEINAALLNDIVRKAREGLGCDHAGALTTAGTAGS